MNTRTTQIKGDPAPVTGGHWDALAAFRGHRFAEGEGGAAPTGGEGAPTNNGTPAGASAAPASPAVPSPATVAAQQQQQAAPETFSRDYVHELREEAKTNRVAHQTAETRATTAETKLAEAQSQLASLQRESAVRAASEGIGNAALLLDSASFNQTIAKVDPSDTEAVKTAITAFVEKNSAYAATPTIPGSSGGTPTGGTNTKPTTLGGAVAAAYSK